MAIFCLSNSLEDLEERLARSWSVYTRDQKPVLAQDLGDPRRHAVLLKDAIHRTSCRTLGRTTRLSSRGAFANIAHGCNSVIATKSAMKLVDYVVTEGRLRGRPGRGEFIDIKCASRGCAPRPR